MKLWRLYRKAHGPGLDGAGGRHAAGRWHQQGMPIVYFGATAAIFVLEKLAHLNPGTLPADLVLGLFEGDFSVEDVGLDEFGGPHPLDDIEWTRKLGEQWLTRGSSCVLRVPSLVVPEERNLVFNPRHKEAPALQVMRERPFNFDARLL